MSKSIGHAEIFNMSLFFLFRNKADKRRKIQNHNEIRTT